MSREIKSLQENAGNFWKTKVEGRKSIFSQGRGGVGPAPRETLESSVANYLDPRNQAIVRANRGPEYGPLKYYTSNEIVRGKYEDKEGEEYFEGYKPGDFEDPVGFFKGGVDKEKAKNLVTRLNRIVEANRGGADVALNYVKVLRRAMNDLGIVETIGELPKVPAAPADINTGPANFEDAEVLRAARTYVNAARSEGFNVPEMAVLPSTMAHGTVRMQQALANYKTPFDTLVSKLGEIPRGTKEERKLESIKFAQNPAEYLKTMKTGPASSYFNTYTQTVRKAASELDRTNPFIREALAYVGNKDKEDNGITSEFFIWDGNEWVSNLPRGVLPTYRRTPAAIAADKGDTILKTKLTNQQAAAIVPGMLLNVMYDNKDLGFSGVGPVGKNSLPMYVGRWYDPFTQRVRTISKPSRKYVNPVDPIAVRKYLEARVIYTWNTFVRASQQLLNTEQKIDNGKWQQAQLKRYQLMTDDNAAAIMQAKAYRNIAKSIFKGKAPFDMNVNDRRLFLNYLVSRDVKGMNTVIESQNAALKKTLANATVDNVLGLGVKYKSSGAAPFRGPLAVEKYISQIKLGNYGQAEAKAEYDKYQRQLETYKEVNNEKFEKLNEASLFARRAILDTTKVPRLNAEYGKKMKTMSSFKDAVMFDRADRKDSDIRKLRALAAMERAVLPEETRVVEKYGKKMTDEEIGGWSKFLETNYLKGAATDALADEDENFNNIMRVNDNEVMPEQWNEYFSEPKDALTKRQQDFERSGKVGRVQDY